MPLCRLSRKVGSFGETYMIVGRTGKTELHLGSLLIFAAGLAGSALVAIVLSWPLMERFNIAETCWSEVSPVVGALAWIVFCRRNYSACRRTS